MGKPHGRRISPADRAAAHRLKALWLAIPREKRPTQQALADRWDGDANQSLISQYLNGHIALNYRAVMFFAQELNCDPRLIRDDLAEQRLTDSVENAGIHPASQQWRLDPDRLRSAMTYARVYLEMLGNVPPNIEEHPRLVLLGYGLLEAIEAAGQEDDFLEFTKRMAAALRDLGGIDDLERGTIA